MRVKLVNPKAQFPTRAHPTDSGFDMYAMEWFQIAPRGHVKIPLGVALEPPVGFEVQLRGRSGMAGKGIMCHHGTIDNAYRGEVAVHLYNHNDEPYDINPGDRVCQIVIKPVPQIQLFQVEELSQTDRGDKGFGSTGR